MNIYFNENSLPILSKIECIEEYTAFVSKSLSILLGQIKEVQNSGYHVFYFDNDKIQQFRKELDAGAERTAFNRILEYLTVENEEYSMHRYTFFQHPNLPVNECLAYASEIEYGALQYAASTQNIEKIRILNFPNTIFTQRPFIPIIKSDADANKKDEFIFLNCVETQANFHLSLLLETTIKPILAHEYQAFYSEYMAFYGKFDWQNWKPNENTFPAHDIIKKHLSEAHTKDKPKVANKEQKKEFHLKWGKIMAILNGYSYNNELIKANSDPRVNDIFQSKNENKNTIFLSTDGENGNLETYDYTGGHRQKVYGIHQGEANQEKPYTINVPESKWLK